jgi:hypothetical protein
MEDATVQQKINLKLETKQELRIVRIRLGDVVSVKAQETLKTLKERGSDVKLEDLFEELLNNADEGYWDRQVERFTPDDYLLDLARRNPEARKYLILQAKRVMASLESGNGVPLEPKRPGRKPRDSADPLAKASH